MTANETALPRLAIADRVEPAWDLTHPPVRLAQFWVVQIGVLTIALTDEVLLDHLRVRLPWGFPDSLSVCLLFIPVVYAALNFGRRGAVATALWATVLVVPHWVLTRHLTPGHFWTEVGCLLMIDSMAVVVGQRVESEQQARQRAEDALLAATVAESRYRLLFEEQPAPVIITDAAGVVAEANAAAARLFGCGARGRRLFDLLSTDVADVLTDQPRCLALKAADGEERIFVPSAHVVAAGDSRGLVQIVLTDITEQQRRREEHRMFAGRLLAVQEDERRRLAQELHDDPLQNLMYLARTLDDLADDPSLPAHVAKVVTSVEAVAVDVATALRKVIRGLRPPVLDDLGVVSALRQLVEEAGKRSGLTVDLSVKGRETRLPPQLELTAYRVIQESLSNAIRHAEAHRVEIMLRFGEQVVLSVADDGRGIRQAADRAGGGGQGFGLLGMRERVSLVGGTLEIEQRRPHGTRVRASLPCRVSADSRPASELPGRQFEAPFAHSGPQPG